MRQWLGTMLSTRTPCLVEYDDAGQDDMGRRRFTLIWRRDGRKKAQCFFARIEDHVKVKREVFR